MKESRWEQVKGILTGRPYTLDLAVEEALTQYGGGLP
jgi:hypothetical protein